MITTDIKQNFIQDLLCTEQKSQIALLIFYKRYRNDGYRNDEKRFECNHLGLRTTCDISFEVMFYTARLQLPHIIKIRLQM